jgi:hypothetical protein
MSPWFSNKPAGMVADWTVCCAHASFLAADANTTAQASAVNQTIFFLSTVNSSIRQNEEER